MNLSKYQHIKIPENSESIHSKSLLRHTKSEDLPRMLEQDITPIITSRSLKTQKHFSNQEHKVPNLIKTSIKNNENAKTPEIILNESNQIKSDHLESAEVEYEFIRVSSLSYISKSINNSQYSDLYNDYPSSIRSYSEWEKKLKNSIRSPNTPIYCQICDESIQAKDICQLKCSDQFCIPCTLFYIKLKIEEGQVIDIMCPNHDCESKLNEDLIKNLVSPELYEKYLKFKTREELSKDPFLRFCPAPDCEGFDKGSSKKQRLVCNQCNFEYCYYCSEKWHAGKKCKMTNEKALDKWANANGVKYCPNCKRKVQKSIGCDHMTCPKCEYEWCWLCGRFFDSSHLGNCEASKLKKLNPSLMKIFLLIISPIIVPFLSIIFVVLCCFKLKDMEREYRMLSRFIKEHLWFCYFISFVIGVILTPLFFVVAPLAISFALIHECLRGYFYKWKRYIANVLLTILFCPFFILFCLFMAFIAHLLGVVFLFWKLCIVIIRCKNPKFLTIENDYGVN